MPPLSPFLTIFGARRRRCYSGCGALRDQKRTGKERKERTGSGPPAMARQSDRPAWWQEATGGAAGPELGQKERGREARERKDASGSPATSA